MAQKSKMYEGRCSKLDANCERPETSKNCFSGKNLSKPTLNSCLRHKNEIEQLEKASIDIEKSEVEINKQKLTTKLNFGVHQRVFGNLTPINVNDSLLLPKAKVSIPKKYVQSNGNIPIPDLRDFLDDIPPLKYVIEEPEIKLDLEDYDFDVLKNYELFKGQH